MYPYSHTISVPDFWKLAAASRVLSADDCRQLMAEFLQSVEGPSREDVKALAQWLCKRKVLSRYQANVLLSGRPGPFLFGDYQVVDRWSEGPQRGFFSAVHKATGHPVLLRFLPQTIANDRSRWATVARLPDIRDPHVVRCYQAVELEKHRFLVFEQLPGQSLADRVRAAGRLAVAEACRVIRAAAQGLVAVHRAGRAHGDVCPRSIWCYPDGRVALLIDGETDLRSPNFTLPDEAESLLRRADYMAPEFTQAGKAPDRLTDLYALGCSLYEVVSGDVPFPEGDLKSKLSRHAREPLKPLGPLGVPPEVERVVAHLMAKNPPLRFQSAAAVVQHLEPFAPPFAEATPERSRSHFAFEQWLRGQRPEEAAACEENSLPRPEPPVVPLAIVEPRRSIAGTRGAPTKKAATFRRRTGRRRRNRWLPATLGCVAALLCLSAGVYVLQRPARFTGVEPARLSERQIGSSKLVRSSESESATAASGAAATDGSRPEPAPSRPEIVEDDGKLLWASPTEGPPLGFEYVPPGGQLFLALRPAALLALPEGQRIWQALGPEFADSQRQWEASSGFKLGEIEQLTISVHDADGSSPAVFCVVHLPEPIATDQLLAKWGNPTTTADLPSLYQQQSRGYFVPAEGEGRVFVMGPANSRLWRMLARGSAPELLRWQVSRLLQRSDTQRHVTLIFAPNQLLALGQSLFAGRVRPIREPLEQLFGTGVNAGLISLHCGAVFFFEVRLETDPLTPPSQLIETLSRKWRESPAAMEQHLAASNPHSYWRRVAFRLPSMLRFVVEQTRWSVEREQVVLNGVLPPSAPHNLAFAADMLMTAIPEGSPPEPSPGQPRPRTIDDLLSARISLRFDQESLESAMQSLVREVQSTYPDSPADFGVRILGDDLKLDGITRNQQIRDFVQENKTVGDVLTTLVMRANPVTTVKLPSEQDQKLLWVVGPDPDDASRSVILITTRQVAARKYTLPSVFQSRQ